MISSLLLVPESKLPIGKWHLVKSVCDEDQYIGNDIDLEFNENWNGFISYHKKDKVYFEWTMDLDTLKFKFTPEEKSKGFILGAEKYICLDGPFKSQMSLKDIDSKCRWILNTEK